MSKQRSHVYSSVQPRTRMLLDEEMMRVVLADVGGMRTAYELEWWASWMLGQVWKQRTRLPSFQDLDWELVIGTPLVEMIHTIGGARARKALTSLAMLNRGPLGSYAGSVAMTLPGARTPAWLTEMASVGFGAARSMQRPGEGEALLLELHRGGEHAQTVAVYIDHQLGGIAKWFRLLEPMEEDDWDVIEMAPVELATAAARVREAIALTDRSARVSTGEEFADLRAYVLARLIDVS